LAIDTVRLGTSFSTRRCAALGLAPRSTFTRVLELGFGLIRVSAYWDQTCKDGYAALDWMLDAAHDARQAVLLTVGMKAIRWPEFYFPADLQPVPGRGGRIGVDSGLTQGVLAFISETVARYRDRSEVVAWQVENEPFNRSGPQRWWIEPRLVRREVNVVRDLDARPIVLNAFAHFDPRLDEESRPRRGLFGMRRLEPEKAILEVADILGLDVYTTIAGHTSVPDWAESAARWLSTAQQLRKTAWITESQAEPWESSSFSPDDMVAVAARLLRAGFSTILLWGCEHWFSQAAAGDASWLEAARLLSLQGSARRLDDPHEPRDR
jgi:hypothetical protein